jgi:hypothetical protein
MKSLFITVVAFCFTVSLAFFSPAIAQTVVVPNGLENLQGNAMSSFPFDCALAFVSMRYQQVYLSSQFPQTGLIDKISFRLFNISNFVFGLITISNVLIELSTTQAQPNALNNTFADNVWDPMLIPCSRATSLSPLRLAILRLARSM